MDALTRLALGLIWAYASVLSWSGLLTWETGGSSLVVGGCLLGILGPWLAGPVVRLLDQSPEIPIA